MTATIQKWGNSQGVRLPKYLLEELSLCEGAEVEIFTSDGMIVIKPPAQRRKTLDELFEGYTGDYMPQEVDWGDPVGGEVW